MADRDEGNEGRGDDNEQPTAAAKSASTEGDEAKAAPVEQTSDKTDDAPGGEARDHTDDAPGAEEREVTDDDVRAKKRDKTDEARAKKRGKTDADARPKLRREGDPPRAKQRREADQKPEAAAKGEPRNSTPWLLGAAVVVLAAWWIWRGQTESSGGATPEAASARAPSERLALAPAPAPRPRPAPAASEAPAAPAAPAPPDEPAPSAAPVASVAPAASAAPRAPVPGGSGTFDRAAALNALAKNASKAAGCRMRGEPGATADVTVTFEPSGQVKEALIRSGPYAGSPTGKCIIKKLSETTVSAFGGEAATVILPVSVH